VSPRGAVAEPRVTRVATLRRRAHRAASILAGTYGSPRHGNKGDPLDELVFIVLSQMTTAPSFGRVYDRLKAATGGWAHVRRMPLRSLKSLIKDAGLSHQKAPRIKAILKKLEVDFGRPSLDPLRQMDDAAAVCYLTSLPGVGVKTAKCVMMYSLGREVLPVDTHVWRVARRLGLVEGAVPYTRVHDALEAVVAPADRYSLHVNALSHGQQICLALRPRCGPCPLRRLCPSARPRGPGSRPALRA
jgi:endonuclease-3